MNLATIPPGDAFLETIAQRWLEAGIPQGTGLILLPTRRAARTLAEAFLRVSDGAPMLLPRITAIGALDEAPLTLAGALDLPPAITAPERLAALTSMILRLPAAVGGAHGADRAWMLARELAQLMDEAERAELDLPSALARAGDGGQAEHWAVTLRFLEIVTRAWPDFLADHGLMNPAARGVALLDAQAAAWRDTPPAMPVWIAGSTGAIPAVARLTKLVASLPQGRVILPGLDLGLDEESVWPRLDAAHPQAGLQSLLAGLGATRGDVAEWGMESPRAALLSAAMLPAEALGLWREQTLPDIAAALAGLCRLSPADAQEEAVAIALILRDALERPGATAALVTPDRALATRVSAELLRWGVVADDSAGEPLAHTPPAVFLRLLAEAVDDGLGPVALLALLKHPFAAAGLSVGACREATRALELACLRGPRPAPGLAGLRLAAQNAAAPIHDLLGRVEACLAPALRVSAGKSLPPAELLVALVAAAEALATTDEIPGPARLWAQEEGETLAATLAEAIPALVSLPDQLPDILPGLLDALLEGVAVRSRRALRGRMEGEEHPRLFIWGLLEARLQAADVIVLGGLAEGVWPPATDPGPWMSRPMRKAAGLPSPEEMVGQAAHDFVMAACAAPVAVLSCPRRRDGAPAVPARWLARLDAYLAGHGTRLPVHPAPGWAARLDQPEGPPRPVLPPRPCPPAGLRPRKLSVTEIETWIADPYAIHARHILRLKPLDPLEQATDAADYGTIVHDGLRRFLDTVGTGRLPPDAARRLREDMMHALRRQQLRPALFEWWAPRLSRIADWVAGLEAQRRSEQALTKIAVEVAGKWSIDTEVGFLLTGRADRIERRADGSLAILDYKTGTPPSVQQVQSGASPQLPLEAAMAAAGAFGLELQGSTGELTYWKLSGGFESGREQKLFTRKDDPAIADVVRQAEAELLRLIAAFDDPARPYLAQPHPDRRPRFPQYGQLARVAEWDLSGDGA